MTQILRLSTLDGGGKGVVCDGDRVAGQGGASEKVGIQLVHNLVVTFGIDNVDKFINVKISLLGDVSVMAHLRKRCLLRGSGDHVKEKINLREPAS